MTLLPDCKQHSSPSLLKMEKRCRPHPGYYKSLDSGGALPRRTRCNPKPDVLGVFTVERIVAKKFCAGKPMYMVKCQGYCSSQNTWEPAEHLSPDLIEAFYNPQPDPVRLEEARERIALVFERGMKVPLQYQESVEVRHDVVRSLFRSLPAEIQAAATPISDEDVQDAGLGPYIERTINANGNRCRIVQLTFRKLLSKSPAFYHEGKKLSRPVERLRVVFRKQYLTATL